MRKIRYYCLVNYCGPDDDCSLSFEEVDQTMIKNEFVDVCELFFREDIDDEEFEGSVEDWKNFIEDIREENIVKFFKEVDKNLVECNF